MHFSQTSNWTDPKKQRSVGSPGRTGNADYFLRQARAPLRSVDIDIGDGSKMATDYVARTRHVTDQRHVSSAPQHPVRRRSDQSGTMTHLIMISKLAFNMCYL